VEAVDYLSRKAVGHLLQGTGGVLANRLY